MQSADGRRFVYEKSQLVEVMCQLRFPTILSIEAQAPAQFQDTVREIFPRYDCLTEQIKDAGGAQRIQKNHAFFTADGASRLNLTQSFIALSTVHYTGWEEFAGLLDEPLGQFIRIYRPAFFDRIGLRYINGVSREKLELTDCRWNDLIQPHCLGPLDCDGIDEQSVTRCSVDMERRLEGKLQMRLHAGPGVIQRVLRTPQGTRTEQSKELHFILDLDFFALGNQPLQSTSETLTQLHSHADRFFSDAITDRLHEAMEPVYV